MKKPQTKRLVTSAACIALGILLPMVFHTIPNAGSIFLPMHIPVLLCGLVCGWGYGLAVGILTPVLSALLTQMPPAAVLPGMACELAVYGLITGLLSRRVRTGKYLANLYISLVSAMLIGRITYGVLNALIFKAGQYSLNLWLTAAFITGLPGIAIQLVLIPPLVFALERAHVFSTTELQH